MTATELLSCLTDRPCEACRFYNHNYKQCCRWECVFNEKSEETDAERLRKGIEELIDDYQHEINEMEEDRMREGVSVSNAFLTGKIGAYGKAVADLKDLLEGVEE